MLSTIYSVARATLEILRTIFLYIEDRDVNALLIGGHALTAFGLQRQTSDIDLLVDSKDRVFWKSLLLRLSYQHFQDDEFYTRWSSRELIGWPIDLMYVDSPTFQKMFKTSIKHNFGVVEVNVVSATHLLALKLHALKSPDYSRHERDLGDVVALVKSGHLGDFSNLKLKELCLSSGNSIVYDMVVQRLNSSL
jgi:hypothetical protein